MLENTALNVRLFTLTKALQHPKMKAMDIITAKYHNLEVDIHFLLNEHLLLTQYFSSSEKSVLTDFNRCKNHEKS
jgi:hypothetical protein